jgi:hypothetical protein
MMPDTCSILIDNVVGMLKVTWCRLSIYMARVIELMLLLLLNVERLLLLLLTVLCSIAVLLSFSFTLPFFSCVRCAL